MGDRTYYGNVLSQVHQRMDRTDAKIDKVEAKVDGLKDLIHSEVKDLLNMIGDHGQRIVRLEERQKKPE